MLDINGLMGKMKDAQAKMKETQEELSKIQEEGEAGAGKIRATLDGHKKVLKIEIDASLMNKEDKKMVEDLTVAAINAAQEKVAKRASEMMQSGLLGGLPNIPGFDLSNFKF